MQSVSKTDVSPAVAQAIVDAHMGHDLRLEAFEELKEGYFNAAYYLKPSDGQERVLKVAPPDSVQVLGYEKDIMRAEVEVMRLVQEQTSMPVPAIYAYDASRQLLGSDYFIMAFVPGIPLHKLRNALTLEENTAIDQQLGHYLREMNAIQGKAFGYYASPFFANWREAFAAMLNGILVDGQALSVQLPCPYDVLSERLTRHFDVLNEVTTPQLVHWDLWDGNVFVDEKTRHITGIIDFERSLWGDPLMEANFRTMDEANAFGEGYGVPMLDTPNKRLRRTLYNVYLYLIMVIEHHYRNYESWDVTNWAHGELVKALESLNAGT
jgi:aminoglycoside phosphotransferase (APT) family kinase protein